MLGYLRYEIGLYLDEGQLCDLRWEWERHFLRQLVGSLMALRIYVDRIFLCFSWLSCGRGTLRGRGTLLSVGTEISV